MSYVDKMVNRISDSMKEELKAALLREEDRRSWYERDEYVQKLKNAIRKAHMLNQNTIKTYTRIAHDTLSDETDALEFLSKAYGINEANLNMLRCVKEVDERMFS